MENCEAQFCFDKLSFRSSNITHFHRVIESHVDEVHNIAQG